MLPIKSMNSIVNQTIGPVHMLNDKTLIPTHWLKKFMDEITSNTDNSMLLIFLFNDFVKYSLITSPLLAPVTCHFPNPSTPYKLTKLTKAVRMTRIPIKIKQ